FQYDNLKLDNSETFNETESDLDLTIIYAEQIFIDINGNLLYINISQSLTVLDILRNEGSIDEINIKIKEYHLYSDLFGLGCKIAQVVTKK
ncbi:7754_t:CDS:1, partial [Racocetra persica]